MGSDVDLISWQHAEMLGLDIDWSSERRIELEFADGSRCFTDGVVKDTYWSFKSSQTNFQREFYVLKNLSVDLILSNDFLYQCDAFTKYADDFYRTENATCQESPYELSLVRHIGWFSDSLQTLYERYIRNGKFIDFSHFVGVLTNLESMPIPSPQDYLAREQILRDEIREEINKLPFDKQQQAMEAELRRRQEWKMRRLRNTAASSTSGDPQTAGSDSAVRPGLDRTGTGRPGNDPVGSSNSLPSHQNSTLSRPNMIESLLDRVRSAVYVFRSSG